VKKMPLWGKKTIPLRTCFMRLVIYLVFCLILGSWIQGCVYARLVSIETKVCTRIYGE
jgi:hypothetical protein